MMRPFVIFAVLVAVSYAQDDSLCSPGDVSTLLRVREIEDLKEAYRLAAISGSDGKALEAMENALRLEIQAAKQDLFYISDIYLESRFLLAKEPQKNHDLAFYICSMLDLEMAEVGEDDERQFVLGFVQTIPLACQNFEHIRISSPTDSCAPRYRGFSTEPDVKLCLAMEKPEYDLKSIHCYQPVEERVHGLCKDARPITF